MLKNQHIHLEQLRIYEIQYILSLKELKSYSTKCKVLEIGAGSGWQSKVFHEYGYQIKAIDIASSIYRKNKVWDILPYDGKKIPFSDNFFDIIYSSNVLEHISHLDQFQQEIHRVLKPNGKVIHLVPTASWRLWTNLTHYPGIFMIITSKIKTKLMHKTQNKQIKLKIFKSKKKYSLFSIISPKGHGERGNAISELYYFSKWCWSSLFKRNNWNIQRYTTNKLFYTGYSILNHRLPIGMRKWLSFFLGSSCHIFILNKK